MFSGEVLPIKAQTEVTVTYGAHTKTAPVLIPNDSPAELLLGTDFLPELYLLPGGGQTAKDGEIVL